MTMTYGNYREAFPDFDPATMPAIPAHWVDTSWANETCPSFSHGACRVFIDYQDVKLREFTVGPRFMVVRETPDHFWENVYDGEDWNDVLGAVG